MNRNLIAPLTGVAFIIVAIVSFLVAGEPPNVKDDGPVKIVAHYLDNEDAIKIGSALAAVAGLLLIFFAGHLRKVLAAASGPGSSLPGIVLVGASIMAVGIAIDATISFAAADSAGEVPPVVIQTLQALWDNDFFPIALGSMVFLLSAGLAIIQTGALPRWLGWVAIVLAILGPTPAGFVSFLGGALWVLVVSIVLTMRASARPPAGPATPAV